MAASNVPRSRRRKRNPKPVTLRTRSLYQRRRDALIETLGSECVKCGEKTASKLTFDHKDGRDWDIARVHGTKRLRIYAEEAEKGELQLLCLSCNSSKQGTPNDQFMQNGEPNEEYTEGYL